jgi:hypothetical protein
MVQPEGLDGDARLLSMPADVEDPLLQLFYGETLSPEEFHEALRKQRATPPAEHAHAAKA